MTLAKCLGSGLMGQLAYRLSSRDGFENIDADFYLSAINRHGLVPASRGAKHALAARGNRRIVAVIVWQNDGEGLLVLG